MSMWSSDETKDYLAYELQVMEAHRQTQRHIVYHWRDIPLAMLVEMGFVNTANEACMLKTQRRLSADVNAIEEFGLDGVAFDPVTGFYHGIQAKLRSSTSIRSADLGTFLVATYAWLGRHNPASKGFLYTNGKIEGRLMSAFVNDPDHLFLAQLPYDPQWRHMLSNGATDKSSNKKLPALESGEDAAINVPPRLDRSYQREAYRALMGPWYKTNKFGVLHMPCGTGKTLVFSEYAATFNRVLILSPTRVAAVQNFERAKEIIGDNGLISALVDCDKGDDYVTRDSIAVNVVWGSGARTLISSTFKSGLDVVREAIFDSGDTDNSIIIVDEAHNLPRSLLELLEASQFSHILLVSATPKRSIGRHDDAWSNVVFHYSLATAIEEKYVCDYRLLVPFDARLNGEQATNKSHQEDEGDEEYDEEDEVEESERNESDEDWGDNVEAKAQFIVDGMLQEAVDHCIVYVPTMRSADSMITAILGAARRRGQDRVFTCRFTNDLNAAQRMVALEAFQDTESSTLYFLVAVRILDEAIDIPVCDSVFFTQVSNNSEGATRMVQRMSRATRPWAPNPHKIARVFLWMPDVTHEVPKCFALLKQVDPVFSTKFQASRVDMLDVVASNTDGTAMRQIVLAMREEEDRVSTRTREVFEMATVTREERTEKLLQLCIDHFEEQTRKGARIKWPIQTTKLGRWWSRVRLEDILTESQRRRVLEIDSTALTVIKRPNVEERGWKLVEYLRQHGRCPPESYITPDGVRLGAFVSNLRLGQYRKTLSETVQREIVKLNADAFRTGARAAEVARKLELCIEFFHQHRRWPPQGSGSLGTFWDSTKQGSVKLTQEMRDRIQQVDSRVIIKEYRPKGKKRHVRPDVNIDETKRPRM